MEAAAGAMSGPRLETYFVEPEQRRPNTDAAVVALAKDMAAKHPGAESAVVTIEPGFAVVQVQFRVPWRHDRDPELVDISTPLKDGALVTCVGGGGGGGGSSHHTGSGEKESLIPVALRGQLARTSDALDVAQRDRAALRERVAALEAAINAFAGSPPGPKRVIALLDAVQAVPSAGTGET